VITDPPRNGKASRYLKRLLYLPHIAAEILERLRRLEMDVVRISNDQGLALAAAEMSNTVKAKAHTCKNPNIPDTLPADDRQTATNPSTAKLIPEIPVPLSREHIAKAQIFANRDDAISTLPTGCKVAEIGVAYGDFTRFILDTLCPSQFDAFDIFRLHQVETIWGRPSAETFGRNTHLEYYENRFAQDISDKRVRTFEGDSSLLMESMPNEYYDIIYIDGDHTLEGVLRDADVAARKLSRGGFLIFNDYVMADHITNSPYGVVQVVNWYCANLGWRVHYIALQNNLFCDICLVRA